MADSKYHSVPDLAWQTAVKLADEREKHYPFDDEQQDIKTTLDNIREKYGHVFDAAHYPGIDTDPYTPPWSDIEDDFKYHAVDEDGDGYFFTEKPTMYEDCWGRNHSLGSKLAGETEESKVFTNNPNWKESLRKRP